MIQIEVLDCPNEDYLGRYLLHKNLVCLGSNREADLRLEDPQLKRNHLLFEIVNDQLLVHLNKGQEFLHVNGKRTTSFKFLKEGDEIAVGGSRIKIQSCQFTSVITKREVLNRNTDELIKEASPLLDFIKELQRDL